MRLLVISENLLPSKDKYLPPSPPPPTENVSKICSADSTIIQNEDGRTRRWEETWRRHGAAELATQEPSYFWTLQEKL